MEAQRCPLTGIRVVELADEQTKCRGLTLAVCAPTSSRWLARLSPFGDHGPWAEEGVI